MKFEIILRILLFGGGFLIGIFTKNILMAIGLTICLALVVTAIAFSLNKWFK